MKRSAFIISLGLLLTADAGPGRIDNLPARWYIVPTIIAIETQINRPGRRPNSFIAITITKTPGGRPIGKSPAANNQEEEDAAG